MSKKIIACAPLPPPNGGITNWYKIVLSEAQKNGYDFITINTSPKTKSNRRSLFYRIFIQGWGMVLCCNKIKRIVRRNEQICAAHIATSGQFGLIRDIFFLKILKKRKIKTIYHIHFGRIPQIFNDKSAEYRLIFLAVNLADVIIAIDLKTYETLKASCPKKVIRYIPNPVEIVQSKQDNVMKSVIFLGSVCKEKGIEELLKAWSDISIKNPEWTLNIVGHCENEYKAYLNKYYSMNRVTFFGYLDHDDAMEELNKASLLVLPSYTEGFPNVIVEAMMREKAVVATDVGAISDILADRCGIVVPPKDVLDLREAIEFLIKNEQTRMIMGANGRKKVLNNYSSELVFKQYEKSWLM